jgi:hypothetical protein
VTGADGTREFARMRRRVRVLHGMGLVILVAWFVIVLNPAVNRVLPFKPWTAYLILALSLGFIELAYWRVWRCPLCGVRLAFWRTPRVCVACRARRS